MFHIACPTCSATIQVSYQMAGQQARCSACNGLMTIPQPPRVAVAQAAAAPAALRAAPQFQAPPPPRTSHRRTSEKITVHCQRCAQVIRVPRAYAGKQGRCKSCGHALHIPGEPAPIPQPTSLPAARPPTPPPPPPAPSLELEDDDPYALTLSVRCPSCQQIIQVPERFAGKKGRCKACREVITIPGGPEPEPQFTAVEEVEESDDRGVKRGGKNRGLRSRSRAGRRRYGAHQDDAPIPAVLADARSGFGALLQYSFKTFTQNMGGLIGYSLLSKLLLGAVGAAVVFVFSLFFFGMATAAARSGSATAIIPAFFGLVVGVFIIAGIYMALQAGMSRICQGYLKGDPRTSWSDGFSELSQAGKGFALMVIIVPVFAVISFVCFIPGAASRSPFLLSMGVLSQAVIALWLGLRFFTLLSNEMVDNRHLGALSTLRSHASLLNGKVLRLFGIVCFKFAITFSVSLVFSLLGFALGAVGPKANIGAALMLNLVNFALIVVMDAFFNVLYSAYYLHFRGTGRPRRRR